MTNRVHIDGPAGIIDIEGEKDFVEGLLQRLFPLIEAGGFGSKATDRTVISPNQDESGAAYDADTDEKMDQLPKPKIKRKRGVTPKGHSCADRMIALKEDGFFKAKRSTGDIVAGLAEKGYTHTSNQVSAAGESLFKRGLLQRTKEATGSFKYFWDRD